LSEIFFENIESVAPEASAVNMQGRVLAIKAGVRSGQMSGWTLSVNVDSDIGSDNRTR